MAFDESLANRLRIQLTGKKNVTEKKMFGGIGFLLHGNMMVGIWKKSLIVRLGLEEGAKALKEPFVRDFDITGRPMIRLGNDRTGRNCRRRSVAGMADAFNGVCEITAEEEPTPR